MGQKTLLSFFTVGKVKQPAVQSPKESSKSPKNRTSSDKNGASSSKDTGSTIEDSPIKPARGKRRPARLIDSDSEDEPQEIVPISSSDSSPAKSEEEKENKSSNIEKKTPCKKEDKEEKSVNSSSSSSSSSSSNKTKIGFTADTVPPLRLTARKQMKRKSNCLEDDQKAMVKKLKLESNTSTESIEESGDEPMEVDEDVPSDKLKQSKKNKIVQKKAKSKSDHPRSKDTSYKNFFSKFQAPKDHDEAGTSELPVELKTEKNMGDDNTHESIKDDTKDACTKHNNKGGECKKENKDSVKDDVESSDIEVPGDETDEGKEQKDSDDKMQDDSNIKDNSTKKTDNSNKNKSKKSPVSSKKSKSTKVKKSSNLNKSRNSESSPNKSTNSVESNTNGKHNDSKSSCKSSSSDKSSTETKHLRDHSPDQKGSPHPGDRPKKSTINPFAAKSKSEITKPYNPGKSGYHPIDDAIWAKAENVPYLALARTFELIEGTSGRLRNIEILSNLLRSVIALTPEDLLHTIYLCLNKVAPAFAGIELNVGENLLFKAVAQTTGRSTDRIKADVRQLGDIGKVAEMSKSNQRVMFQPNNLNIRAVFDKLREIALMTGNSVMTKKVDKIKAMFVACRESEARFLIRSLGGKLRIGLAEQSVLQAIAQACYLTPPGQDYPPEVLNTGKGQHPDKTKAKIEEFTLIVKTTYCECPSYDSIIPVLLSTGVESLPDHCKLTTGVPLKPMLAHPTKGVSEVFKRFEDNKFTCEYKYDGERAQIHLSTDGTTNVYSRNQEDNTTKYPDIINRLKASIGDDVKSCILDTEAVAWDREKKRILPFQILSTRKRKDVNESDVKVQVCVFPFDLLYLNGKSLVKESFENRRALLKANFKEVEGEFTFAKSMDSTNTEDIQDFLEESIKGNCEGLMVKTLDVDATYEIAKRSHNWLKLKKDYLEGVGDSLDVVVIGGYMGMGKRAGQYGGFLLACYDPNNEEFQSLCKIGTGFKDEDLAKHSEFFKEHCITAPKSYYRYDSSVEPDQWFDAVQVWEIKCADLSISPVHKAAAGTVDPEKGISLRFPRFLKIREDKTPEMATSAEQIADMYNNQDQIKNAAQDKQESEDFY